MQFTQDFKFELNRPTNAGLKNILKTPFTPEGIQPGGPQYNSWCAVLADSLEVPR